MDIEIRSSFTQAQKEFLLKVADDCVSCGAEKGMLAPLYALIFIPFPQPELSEADIILGQEIARCLDLVENESE